jgi:hypothetical protein
LSSLFFIGSSRTANRSRHRACQLLQHAENFIRCQCSAAPG